MKTAVLPILCRAPVQVPGTVSVPGTFRSPRRTGRRCCAPQKAVIVRQGWGAASLPPS